MDINAFLGIVIFVFAIADPIGVIPLYLGYTSRYTKQEAHRIVVVASFTVALVLCFSIIAGERILTFFHVSIDDFRVAGGLLVLLMALEMFRSRHGKDDPIEISKEELAVSPLALPMLAGPGLISILVTYSSDAKDWTERGFLILACIVVSFMIAIVLWAAHPLRRILGNTGIAITTRIMGLIVAAIGVNFITTGLKAILPGLAG